MEQPDLDTIAAKLDAISTWMSKHDIADNMRFQQTDERISVLPTKQDLEPLATKTDIAEMKEFMQNVHIGFGVIRFTWNNAAQIGAFLLFIFGVLVFIKYGILGAVMYFIPK